NVSSTTSMARPLTPAEPDSAQEDFRAAEADSVVSVVRELILKTVAIYSAICWVAADAVGKRGAQIFRSTLRSVLRNLFLALKKKSRSVKITHAIVVPAMGPSRARPWQPVATVTVKEFV